MHFARPGDPYSAAQIVLAATFLDDRALAEAWIEEARRVGGNNRWEFFARHSLAEADGDWATVAEIGAVRGGPVGAFLRGLAASRSDAWHEARRLLLESLQLANYDAVQGARLIHMAPLLELAWVERQLDMEGWDERAANIEKLIGTCLGRVGPISTGALPHPAMTPPGWPRFAVIETLRCANCADRPRPITGCHAGSWNTITSFRPGARIRTSSRWWLR